MSTPHKEDAAENARMLDEEFGGDKLPTVTHEGVVKLGDLEMTVLRLSNGQSVIEAESFRRLMDALFGEDVE